MSTAAVEIANLLYRYAELFDAGDLDAAAELFSHARIRAGDDLLDRDGIRALWGALVRIHPDGTPRTRHLVTNPIIEVDESAGTASCRSYYTVLQAADGVALQVIAAGRYRDEFERVDGRWRFTSRDYTLDLAGDLAAHLRGGPW